MRSVKWKAFGFTQSNLINHPSLNNSFNCVFESFRSPLTFLLGRRNSSRLRHELFTRTNFIVRPDPELIARVGLEMINFEIASVGRYVIRLYPLPADLLVRNFCHVGAAAFVLAGHLSHLGREIDNGTAARSIAPHFPYEHSYNCGGTSTKYTDRTCGVRIRDELLMSSEQEENTAEKNGGK